MKMGVISQYADQVIASGAYEPLDRNYVMNKIRGLVGDEDVAVGDGRLVDQLVELAIAHGAIEDSVTDRSILNDQLFDDPKPSAG